jgi:hypothetical protein
MGCSPKTSNKGEDFMITLLTNLKACQLKYQDITDWISHNLFTEIKGPMISEKAGFEFIEEVLVESDVSKNSHKSLQISILKDYFYEQYKFNGYIFELCLLSILSDLKKDKLEFYWKIVVKIMKGQVSYGDFKELFRLYLRINLWLNTSIIYNSPNIPKPIYNDLKILLIENYNYEQIDKYADSFYKTFEKDTILPDDSTFTESDCYKFFNTYNNYEAIFNIYELRKDFLLYIK